MFTPHTKPIRTDVNQSQITWWARINSTIPLFFIFHFSLFIFQSCGLDIENPTPPSPPHWVQKSLPEEWPERGIDAHESGGIFLEWEPNSAEEITAYKIYRAKYFEDLDSLESMILLAIVDQTSQKQYEYIDIEVQVGQMVYYSIVALDGTQNVSVPSDSIYYCLHQFIRSDMMIPNGLSEPLSISRTLNWRNFYLDATEDYCLTILSLAGEFLLRQRVQPQNYVGGVEIWAIPDDVVFEANQQYQWRIDTGARYVEGVETAGSESIWASFVYVSP